MLSVVAWFSDPGANLTICSPGQMELCFWQRSELFYWTTSQRTPSIIRFFFPWKKKRERETKLRQQRSKNNNMLREGREWRGMSRTEGVG